MKIDRTSFFDGFRAQIDSTIEQQQVDGLNFLLDKMEADPFWKFIPQISYALATVYHETAGSFQPVEEGYYLAPPQSRVKTFQKKLRYFPYFGRGYVQLTWKKNYEFAGRQLSVDLVDSPELALTPDVAYRVLTMGMHRGWFTGKKLDDFIKGTMKDYVGARQIINGQDKAGLIAGYARSFEQILKTSAAGSDSEFKDQGGNSAQTEPQTPTVTDPLPIVPPDASVTVQKEKPSIWAKVVAAFAAITGLGINAGTLIQQKLQELTPMQIGYLIAALGLVALGVWVYQKAAKGAQMRTLALIETASNQTKYKVELTK